jgi:hypothetical protein
VIADVRTAEFLALAQTDLHINAVLHVQDNGILYYRYDNKLILSRDRVTIDGVWVVDWIRCDKL